ncbi:hypothetical protein McpAg1_00010 [Methanocorpusculaceae archaeon Ag1]|uniref:Uncharacterized protein n=1 Tax=Methanorbis furvi TaxID=3028299 RepID=A0AAE4SAU1_9EURY|nr:hypothetical protein [Methanocorpusculaceae archaeon Ag1]
MLDVQVGLFCSRRHTRVADDDVSAFGFGLHHSAGCERVGFEVVGTDNEQTVGDGKVVKRVGRGSGAEDHVEAGDGGGVTETGTVVDVRSLENDSGELLHCVVVFVATAGRGDDSDLVRLVLGEVFCDDSECFVPGCGFELTGCFVFDQRGLETVFGDDELPAVDSFRAEFAFVDRTALAGLDVTDLAVFDDEIKGTAGTAVRAGSGYILNFHG